MAKQTQKDHVEEDQGMQEEFLVEKLNLPGIKELHLKPVAEIAEALATVLKSRAGIKKLSWEIGQAIEVTSVNLRR